MKVRLWQGPVAAAAAVGLGAMLPTRRVGPRGRAALAAGAGIGAVLLARASGLDRTALGLDPSRIRAGLRWGGVAATVIGGAYLSALTVPVLRARFVDETGGGRDDFYEWIGVHIPMGTVLAEELLFRGVLTTLIGPFPQAVVFGLWHVRPALLAGDSVPGTVLVTGLSGLVFAWLRRGSGSVLAPALAHLALNVGGAVAVRVATAARTGDEKHGGT
ncbi:CPBP family glutamic-type intramembrane protease [Rhodococcus yananensis]|uniref:CPBP family glutamic-type intramembrane protease n=1 Tax=Rhodococcus yananensis TaxID=2879464 RepID=UPI001CF89A90|nr:CPBP family intramembrane glutamic endopeptidase [Rhodococcus yananensis]